MIKKPIIVIAILITLIGCYLYFMQTTSVETVLVYKQKNPSKKKLDSSPLVFFEYAGLNTYMYEWIGDSLQHQPIIDFNKYDYIVAFGMPLKKAYYYKHRSHPNDDCGYMKEIAISRDYQSMYTDTVYFYKIVKGKYRNPCP